LETLFPLTTATKPNRALDRYRPDEGLKQIAVAEAAAKHFARARDLDGMRKAVHDKLVAQRYYVMWYDAQGFHGGDRRSVEFQDLPEQNLNTPSGFVRNRWRRLLDPAVFEKILTDTLEQCRRLCEQERGKDPMAARGQPLRDGPDFWPTPDTLIRAAREYMVPFLPPGQIWECACGDGRLGRGIGAGVMTDKYPQDSSAPLDFTVDDPPQDDLIAFTNQPFNAADAFLTRGLELLDAGRIRGLVLLLRHDHFMAGGKTEALNRATFEVHCNWRPIWIPNTEGNPRWAFAWVYWGPGGRCPPLYLREGAEAAA
jgi:hypothetical protein